MNLEEWRMQLGENLNITKVIEIKPYSSLIIICRSDRNMPVKEQESLASALGKYFSETLNNKCLILFTSNSSIELDFYRIDPNG